MKPFFFIGGLITGAISFASLYMALSERNMLWWYWSMTGAFITVLCFKLSRDADDGKSHE
jgi:uncharacterized BrkB/YihY/UPF0761 family membrane protein